MKLWKLNFWSPGKQKNFPDVFFKKYQTFEDDFSIIELKKGIKFTPQARPLYLPKGENVQEFKSGEKFLVSGWGWVNDVRTLGEFLRLFLNLRSTFLR